MVLLLSARACMRFAVHLLLLLPLLVPVSCQDVTEKSETGQASGADGATVAAVLPVMRAPPNTKERIRGAVLGALVADAMCMGSHYEYNATLIQQLFPTDRYMDKLKPRKNVHTRAEPGDQTSYGEYNVLMLEYMAQIAPQPFVINDDFLNHWKPRIFGSAWKQQECRHSQYTVRQLMLGVPIKDIGDNSNTMPIRSLPLLGYSANERDVIKATKNTMFTHLEAEGHWAAEFFTRVAFRIIHPVADTNDMSLRTLMETVADDMDRTWVFTMLDNAFEKVEEATNGKSALSKLKEQDGDDVMVDDLAISSMGKRWSPKTTTPVEETPILHDEHVGKDSASEGTLPGAVYFILKYAHDPIVAFQANAKVGGDSGSRAIAIGMVLGAKHGIHAIPEKPWLETLNHYQHVTQLLQQLPLLKVPEETKINKDEL